MLEFPGRFNANRIQWHESKHSENIKKINQKKENQFPKSHWSHGFIQYNYINRFFTMRNVIKAESETQKHKQKLTKSLDISSPSVLVLFSRMSKSV